MTVQGRINRWNNRSSITRPRVVCSAMMSLQTAPLTKLHTSHVQEKYTNSHTSPAAITYWQSLFKSHKLSPPEYKYLFPQLNNMESEHVKEILSYKLTQEMSLMEEADWSGMNAVGLTAFWLKVLSEPKVPQLRKCKAVFVSQLLHLLSGTELLVQNEEEGETTATSSTSYFINSSYFGSRLALNESYSFAKTNCLSVGGDVKTSTTPHILPVVDAGDRLSSTAASRNRSTCTVPLSHVESKCYVGDRNTKMNNQESTTPLLPVTVTDPSRPVLLTPKAEGKEWIPADCGVSIATGDDAPTLKGQSAARSSPNGKLEMEADTSSVDQLTALPVNSPSQLSPSDSLLYQADGTPFPVADEGHQMEDMWTERVEGTTCLFSCKSCNYVCTYKSRIKQHMRAVHSSLKPYKCEYCDHTTAVRASLTKHVNAVHKKLKPFHCSLCSYTCNLKRSLEVHMSGVHHKQYKHTCPYCDYAASAKNVVDIHIQAVHNKCRPYKCPHCDYSSSYPQYIPKHIAAVHDRQKPFACPHCSYRSSYKTYLQKHCDAVHNNIKPFSCPQCPYTTSYSQYLNKHISAVHRDEKPHKCPHCQFRCAYKQYINKHIQLVHPEKVIESSSKEGEWEMSSVVQDSSNPTESAPLSNTTALPQLADQQDCFDYSAGSLETPKSSHSLSYDILTGNVCASNTSSSSSFFNVPLTSEKPLPGMLFTDSTSSSLPRSAVWPNMATT